MSGPQQNTLQVNWTRPAEFISAVNWRTHEFRVDLGFHTYRRAFASIIRGVFLSSDAGTAFVKQWYDAHEDLVIRTVKDDDQPAQSAFRYSATVQGTSKETGQRDDLLRDVMALAQKVKKPIGEPKPLEILEVDWAFPAGMENIVDGDTQKFTVDVGFYTDRAIVMRLLGVNCPEVKGKEKEQGLAASEYSRQWYETHTDIKIRTRKDTRGKRPTDSFGRFLVEVQGKNTVTGMIENLAQCLLGAHHARVYMADLEDSEKTS